MRMGTPGLLLCFHKFVENLSIYELFRTEFNISKVFAILKHNSYYMFSFLQYWWETQREETTRKTKT
jgi:hypothetical protein